VKKEMKNYIQSIAKPEAGDKRISILEIIGTATRGGMENYIINFLKNLPVNTFRITCICPCESLFTNALRQVGVEAVYVTPLSDNPEWRSIQMAMEVCRLHQVDVLHAHMPKSHVLAGITGALLQKPVVATVHGMHITPHELGVTLATKSTLAMNCLETYIQALALGVPEERVNLFHNGVDTEAFKPGNRGDKLRERIAVSPGTLLVGFVARLEHEKGPDLFLRAAGHVHESLPDVHFAVVGAGSMLKRLLQMRQFLQLENHLHFVDWSTDPAEVYPAFDLMAHTSRNDGTSLVLLEAMACGRPVVGMSVGGVREVIENEHTGMLVEPNDWEAMGNQIISLLQQPGVLQSMGEAARKRVETNFNVLANSRKLADLLSHVALSAKEHSYDKIPDLSKVKRGIGSFDISA
jgi:glycosyltransferase involved in cell wall biosynthesis